MIRSLTLIFATFFAISSALKEAGLEGKVTEMTSEEISNIEEKGFDSKTAAKHGGMYISHIRDEGEYLLESIEELITIAKEADIAAEIYHLKASGKAYWPKLDTAFDLIQSARAEGLKITADIYTYPASSTGLHVQLPEWVREGGIPKTIERLADKSLRKKILKDIKFEYGPDKILFVGFNNPDLRVHIGKRLDEVAEILNKTPAEAMVDLIVEDDSRIQVVYFSMSEENIAKKMAKPWSMGSPWSSLNGK